MPHLRIASQHANGPSLKSSLRLACAPAPDRDSASKKAVTADILALLLQACAGERLVDLRDRALLLTTFASPQREIAKSGSALGSAAKVVHLKTTKMYPNLSFNPSVPDVKLLPVAWRRQFHGER